MANDAIEKLCDYGHANGAFDPRDVTAARDELAALLAENERLRKIEKVAQRVSNNFKPCTCSPNGTQERRVTIAVANRLEAALVVKEKETK